MTGQSEFGLETYKPTRTPSKYQSAIYDWIRTGTGNAVVEAVAGSGKTTTMVDALLLTRGRVLFTAFNQSIAAELKKRAPSHVTVSTLHSLGLRALRNKHRSIVVDDCGEKLTAATTAAFPDRPAPEMKEINELRRIAKRVISLAKATLVDPQDVGAVTGLMEHFEIESEQVDDLSPVVGALPAMMRSCLNDTWMADFDDMVWMPVAGGVAADKFDWIFVDECQDMNRCQVELIMASVGPSTRVVCVGDRNQSIYGFRGADSEAIPAIIARLSARTFPLSITYRCPKSHVELAKQLVPIIEARPAAPDGTVGALEFGKALETMTPFDLVLCRTNAPLVQVAFSLIRLGKKATIRGRDIGAGIASLIKKIGGRSWSAMPTDILLEKLDRYEAKEIAKLTASGKSTVGLTDKIDTIRVLAEDSHSAGELVGRIEAIFDDSAGGVVCSSVHRAKGLEADRVFIVAPDLMPHPMAREAWEVQQEQNIRYVALTRSKNELWFVNLPDELRFKEGPKMK